RSWKNKYEKKGRWFINLTRPKLDINAVQAAVPMKYKGFLWDSAQYYSNRITAVSSRESRAMQSNPVSNCRAPDVAFIPEDIFLSLDEKQLWSFEGQPFTS
ncbi:17219_t:CDS:2, partial [Rhizophagus irregularis]